MMRIALILLICLLGCSARAAGKFIEYGWDCPTTALYRQDVREMEKIPFDGIVIKVAPADEAKSGHGSLTRRPFSRRRFEPDEYQHAIDDLIAVKDSRFTDNLIQMVTSPGDVDWFDPDWDSITYNAGIIARIAKLGGCRGIMIDPEQYSGYSTWGYARLPQNLKDAHTFEEYRQKVRQRGREFIRAINSEYPGILILTLFGPSYAYLQSTVQPLSECEYGFLSPFFDGICEAADENTIIVDGYEISYPYRIREAFQQGREYQLVGAKSISQCPEEFAKHMRCGFGIWADYNSGKIGWHPDDLTKNWFSPAGLQASLNYALTAGDGYVWVYCERFSWFDGTAPKEFVEALRLAKERPGKPDIPKMEVPTAEEQPDYADDKWLAVLRQAQDAKDMIPLFDLPKTGWRFHTDPGRFGEKRGWHRPGFDDSGWRDIKIGRFWEQEGELYDGTAWYRLRLDLPKLDAKGRIYLAFGAADEIATVWVNGIKVGVHDQWEYGWNTPFAFDVTSALRPGATNVIAVRVFDFQGGGGLWKSIKLMTK